MAGNILDNIRSLIRREMNDRLDNMADGSALAETDAGKIAVAHAKAVGVIEGLALAERAILDVVEQGEVEEAQDV